MRNNLKAIRTLRGLKQQDVADSLGVKVGTYRAWEQGRNDMGFDTACRIATLLGCTLDELAGRTPAIRTEYHLMEMR